MPVYIAEQHIQEWTSAAIVQYFRARGYTVRDWHLTQDLEKHVPTDWIFVDQTRLKVFGVQYKALYSNGNDYWQLDRDQHEAVQHYPWVFYGASEMTHPRQQRDALRLVRIYATDLQYRHRLSRRQRRVRYLRWPTFFRAFEACLLGYRVNSRSELVALLGDISGTGPPRNPTDDRSFLCRYRPKTRWPCHGPFRNALMPTSALGARSSAQTSV